MAEVSIVRSEWDSWQGLYIDGVLEEEGAELQVESILAALGITVNCIEADEDWMADAGSLPENLEDVVRTKGY